MTPPYLCGYRDFVLRLTRDYDMPPEDAEPLLRCIDDLVRMVDDADQKYQKVLAELDAMRTRGTTCR